jgi:amidase
MSDPEWWRKSAASIVSSIAKNETTAEAVLESHLARMDAVNPQLNAVVVDLRDAARVEAREADKRQRSGLPLPPLHGVPILTKINSDQAGQATSDGIPALVDNIATQDSPQIANLRNAGAIILGRSNAPEFSLRWHTENPLYGRTKNPWHDGVTSGGSSGGASTSVASGIVPIAHGNDLGGSLRYPASVTGLVSLKPTAGAIPEYCASHGSEWPPAIKMFHTQGVIVRDVGDARLSHEVLTKQSALDPWWAPGFPETIPTQKEKVAVCLDPGGFGVHPQVEKAVDAAAKALASAGYDVTFVDDIPRVDDVIRLWANLVMTECALGVDAMKPLASPKFMQILEAMIGAYGVLDLPGYITGFGERTAVVREIDLFLENYPILLTPVSCLPPMAVNAEPETAEEMAGLLQAQRMMLVGNLTGLPALTLPVLVDADMPFGVQLIGRRYCDRDILRVGGDLEHEIGFDLSQLWDRL